MAKYKIIPSSRTIVQSPISIGHKAEKGVEAIEFDLTAWVETYGSGTLTVIMRRWGDAIPYPIALEIDENNKATWTLSDIDTAKAGMAYAQLSYIVGDEVVKKSDIYTFRVMDSLTGEGEPPEAYESWLEHLQHLAAEAMAEVLDIEGIVTDKTLTVDGGIADAKATGDALSALEDQFSEKTDQLKADLGDKTGSISKNFFGYHSNPYYTPGQYYSKTGDIVTASSWSTFTPDISGYDEIEYSGLNNAGGAAVVSCWFGSNMRFIDYFKQAVGTNRISVPEGAQYLGLSINRTQSVLDVFTVRGIVKGSINEAIGAVNTEISTINSKLDSIDIETVPDYFDSQLATKEPTIIGNMNACGRNGETFVFITDIHWETNYRNSPALVSHVLKNTKVSNVFCGGDIINEGAKAEMYKTMIDCIRSFQFVFSGNFLPIARGNHDDNSNWSSSADVAEYEFDYDTVFALMYKDIADDVTFMRPGTEFSFYFDHVSTKTRYIFLDTQRNGRTIPTTALISLLNATPQDYKIVFIAHFIYTSSGFTSGAVLLFHIINAFNGKTSGSYAGANFDFSSSNGKAICVIAGHTHADYQWDKDDEDNISGVPIIITDTDSTRDSAAIEGTSDSQCFDVITINYNTNTINCVRIGRGSDRTFVFD